MAWQYADWATKATDAERITAINHHVAEIEAVITAGMTAEGVAVDPRVLNDKVTRLLAERNRLQAVVDIASGPGGGRARAVFAA